MYKDSSTLKNLPSESIIDLRKSTMKDKLLIFSFGIQQANKGTEQSYITILTFPKQRASCLISQTKIPWKMPKIGYNNLSYIVGKTSPKFF